MVSKESLIPIVILTGPTASGKTHVALQLAEQNKTIEILNADSLLVYRHMNIGTAKPNPQELQRVPHHLIDIRDPDEPFTAGEFFRAAQTAITEIQKRNHRVLIVGGTGFYLKALIFGLWEAPPADPSLRNELNSWESVQLHLELKKVDPESAHRIGLTDRYRLIRALEIYRLTGKTPTLLQAEHPQVADPRFRLWILDRPPSEFHQRIQTRTEQMLDQGLIDEVRFLKSHYPQSRALLSIGYAQTSDFLEGKLPAGRKIKPGLDGLNEEVQLATRQLVKQQRTWFRKQNSQVPESKKFLLDPDWEQLKVEFKKVYP